MQQNDPLSFRKFFTKAAPALSKPSASSNDSSASRYAARRPRRTTAPSSRSPAPSSSSNPSTQPRLGISLRRPKVDNGVRLLRQHNPISSKKAITIHNPIDRDG